MRYLITLLLTIFCLKAAAFITGTDSLKNNKGADTIAVVKKRSIAAGVEYGSDASFFGRTNQTRFPYVTADAIYNTKSGFFVYGSSWKVLSSVPFVDEVDLGTGYSYRLSKDFNGSISYTKFLFSNQSKLIKSSSSNDVDFKNTVDFKWFKTSVTMDYLYGKSNDFFLTLTASRYLESKWSVFDYKDYITFTPSLSVIFGTQNFVENFSIVHNFFGDPDDPNKKSPHGPVVVDDYAIKNTEFNPLSYSIKLPIGYNRPHYTIEAAYKYAIPVNVQGSLQNTHESFFNLTFFYIFY